MHGEREITFDDLPQVESFTTTVDWRYEYTPGKYNGLPENCYPDELDMEVTPLDGWENSIMGLYIAAARAAIKQVQAEIDDLDPSEWAQEAAESAAEDRAEAEYDRRDM